jgi:antitoxin component YwqK of YwqJK toxin-antitoxin module
MRTQFLQIGLCLLIASIGTAQHTDKIDMDEYRNGALHNGLDEIVHTDGTVKSEASVAGLVKHIPLSKNKQYAYSRYKTSNGRSVLIASEGGKEVYSVELKRNKMDGIWNSRYTNGQLIDSGLLNKNIPDGEWKSWYSNGQVRTVRTYSSSKLFLVQNQIARYNPKTTTNQLALMAVKRDGTFEAITRSSNAYNNLPGGGEPYTPPFATCLPHGLYMNYYASGIVKDSGLYKDGLRDGLWVENFENGQLNTSGSYLRGQKNGGWKTYNKKGKLIELSEYQKGKLIHRKQYQ